MFNQVEIPFCLDICRISAFCIQNHISNFSVRCSEHILCRLWRLRSSPCESMIQMWYYSRMFIPLLKILQSLASTTTRIWEMESRVSNWIERQVVMYLIQTSQYVREEAAIPEDNFVYRYPDTYLQVMVSWVQHAHSKCYNVTNLCCQLQHILKF